MDQTGERLCEEIKKHPCLYDSLSQHRKDNRMVAKSWREISLTVGVGVPECMKRWKNMRDKFVRLRKRMASESQEAGRRRVTAFYIFLSWLGPFVRHRNTAPLSTDKFQKRLRPSRNCSSEVEAAAVEVSVEGSSEVSYLSPLSSEPSPRPPSPRMAGKRLKGMDQDECLQKQLEELRVELQQRLSEGDDVYTRFGQTVAGMIRRLPDDQRSRAMFEVHKVLFHVQQQAQD
ncbi:proline-rich protein 12-like [Xyrichtys novacula]|uniref:Proline-rich protein 12-like n=1 Tax=Xyrichtys novacula TaxID=13765 RepID=A0AAV1ET24_XYRNO|nr:proline-rich protein 12-like [Xyrichtys novacula]